MLLDRPASNQPIPDNAKLVFKGVLFDVFQWEQELYDGSKALFEKLKRPDTVVVIPILGNGKILTTEQFQPGRKPFVGVVGGRVEKNETVIEAAERELAEEAGVAASNFDLWFSLHPTTKIDWVVYILFARGIRPMPDFNQDPGEKIQIKEVSFDEFLKYGKRDDFVEVEMKPCLLMALYDSDEYARLRHSVFKID